MRLTQCTDEWGYLCCCHSQPHYESLYSSSCHLNLHLESCLALVYACDVQRLDECIQQQCEPHQLHSNRISPLGEPICILRHAPGKEKHGCRGYGDTPWDESACSYFGGRQTLCSQTSTADTLSADALDNGIQKGNIHAANLQCLIGSEWDLGLEWGPGQHRAGWYAALHAVEVAPCQSHH